jgi:zinc protease
VTTRSKRSALVALVVLALLCAACAPQRAPLPPPELPLTRTPDAAFRAHPPRVTSDGLGLVMPELVRETLPNGFELWVVSRRDLPMVSVSFVTRAGGEDAMPADPGLAVLTGDMLLRGTRMPDGRVQRQIAIHRRTPAVGTSMELTHVSFEVLSRSFGDAVAWLGHLVRTPAFESAELERQRAAQIEELRDEAWSIQGTMRRLSARLHHGDGHRLAALPSGDPERVESFAVADVRRFHAWAYRPEVSALVVVGDVSAADARALAKQHFGDWAPPPKPPDPAPVPLTPAPANFAIHAIDQPSPQTHLMITSGGMARGSADYDACVLMGYVLGGLFESRGNQALRHASGAGYGAHFEVDARRHTGELYFWTVVDNRVAGASLTEMQTQLLRLQREQVSAAELLAAKARYLALIQDALATNDGTAGLLLEWFAFPLPDEALTGLEMRVRALTSVDLMRVAQRYFDVARTPVIVSSNLIETQASLASRGRLVRYRISR